jgi:hypothetical protein
MTEPPPSRPHDSENLEAYAITFMGRFSGVQMLMDSALDGYVAKKMPHLGPAIAKDFLSKLSDDRRLRLFLAFTRDAGYSGNLSHAELIYNRAKQTRDLRSRPGHVRRVQLHAASLARRHTAPPRQTRPTGSRSDCPKYFRPARQRLHMA